LLEMHLAREEAIKAVPAMGNNHRTHCARDEGGAGEYGRRRRRSVTAVHTAVHC
jgi:hypothetical protein